MENIAGDASPDGKEKRAVYRNLTNWNSRSRKRIFLNSENFMSPHGKTRLY